MKRLSQAHLQDRILLFLSNEGTITVSSLAQNIGASRPSTSRAVNALILAGFVAKDGRSPVLTEAGRKEVIAIEQKLPRTIDRVQRAAKRLAAINKFQSLPAVLEAAASQVKFPKEIANFALSSVPENDVNLNPVEIGNIIEGVISRTLAFMEDNNMSFKAIHTAFEKAVDSLLSFSKSFEWFDEIKRELEELGLAGPAMQPIFLTAGFWVSPSTPLWVLRHIKSQYDATTLTAEELSHIFIEVYRARDCELLRGTIEQEWMKNPLFAARKNILLDALKAHIEGKYTLSIPALLPQIEGIAVKLTQGKHGKPYKHVSGAIHKIEKGFEEAISQEVLFKYITTMAFVDTSREDFKQELAQRGLTAEQVLQRNDILHGVVFDYASQGKLFARFSLT